ncbi:MAG: hypothetical protein M0R48_10990 [Candidatus Omnitrophica bacterium]|nr:hypothetical protein [Candidatus Omnitrophota bacterium]
MKTNYDYMRPTDRRKKIDSDFVFAVLRETQGTTYNEMFNPFEIGSLRHARFERYYNREQKKWLDTEARFEDLADVYGEFRPDKLGMIPERKDFQSLTEEEKKAVINRVIAESGIFE